METIIKFIPISSITSYQLLHLIGSSEVNQANHRICYIITPGAVTYQVAVILCI